MRLFEECGDCVKYRRSESEPEHENSERWLLTYSDLITLLLALFIIMYTMSTLDLEKMKALSQNLNAAFNGTTVADTVGTAYDTGDDSVTYDSGASGYSGESPTPSPLDEIYEELNQYIKDNNLENTIELENTSTYVKVILKDVVLFVPDSAQMIDESEPILQEIQKALSSVYDKIDHITISGHTADPSNDQDYSTDFGWQLSVNRAVNVLNYMVDCGLPQNKLSIEGNSHFEPVGDNATAEGLAQNRRVEITISKNADTSSTD